MLRMRGVMVLWAVWVGQSPGSIPGVSHFLCKKFAKNFHIEISRLSSLAYNFTQTRVMHAPLDRATGYFALKKHLSFIMPARSTFIKKERVQKRQESFPKVDMGDTGLVQWIMHMPRDGDELCLDLHVVFKFHCQEDAAAMDPRKVYAALNLWGVDANRGVNTSWMSLSACQELETLLDAETAAVGDPPFLDCAVPGSWDVDPAADDVAGPEDCGKFQRSAHAVQSMAQQCLRLPAAVLFRYSAISGCSIYVRMPDSGPVPVAVDLVKEYTLRIPGPLYASGQSFPAPITTVVPFVQAEGSSVLQIPLTGWCFLGALVDCTDVTSAYMYDALMKECVPMHVKRIGTHTLVSPLEYFTWEALTCGRDGHMLRTGIPHKLVVRTTCTTRRVVVVTQINMNFRRSIWHQFYMDYFDKVLLEACSGAEHCDSLDDRLSVPCDLLRVLFQYAHQSNTFMQLDPCRLAWMQACVRARGRCV